MGSAAPTLARRPRLRAHARRDEMSAMPVPVPNLIGVLPGMTAVATKMMNGWMARAKIPDVPKFIEMARELNVQLFACSTTMGVMGIRENDLIAGVRIAGAAAFLDFAATADVQLFV